MLSCEPLRELSAQGVFVGLAEGKLRLAPADKVTEDIRRYVQGRRAEIMSALSALPDASLARPDVLAARWGEHAPLVTWFLTVRQSLPVEPFNLSAEGETPVWLMAPLQSYARYQLGIEAGPGFKYARELVSILKQLRAKFPGVRPW